jgi:hypothetical protein
MSRIKEAMENQNDLLPQLLVRVMGFSSQSDLHGDTDIPWPYDMKTACKKAFRLQ